ncbi:MAG: DNA-3-methyladenine glycosylase I [Myxococcota bacterium]
MDEDAPYDVPTVREVASFDRKVRFECARCDRLGMVAPKGVHRRFRVRMADADGEERDYCIVCASIRTGVRQGVLMALAGTGRVTGSLPAVAGWCPVDGALAQGDDAVFEALAAAVFQARFRPDIVRARWPAIRDAFSGFALDEVSAWTDLEADRLLAAPGMIRNPKRVLAVLRNARALAAVSRQHGGFATYVASFAGDHDALVADVDRWAHYVGAPSIRWFLRCVGVEAPGAIRPSSE